MYGYNARQKTLRTTFINHDANYFICFHGEFLFVTAAFNFIVKYTSCNCSIDFLLEINNIICNHISSAFIWNVKVCVTVINHISFPLKPKTFLRTRHALGVLVRRCQGGTLKRLMVHVQFAYDWIEKEIRDFNPIPPSCKYLRRLYWQLQSC